MNKYAIFIDDCEIHLDLEIGDFDSLDAIREVIEEELRDNKSEGYLEQYPFWLGYWEVSGYGLPSNFDYSQILEL